METNKLTIEDKKYLAKTLYVREQLDAKMISKRISVSEKTLSKWVHDGNWKDLRNRLLIGKDEQLRLMYQQLENLNKDIQASPEGYASTKQADILVKYAAAIRSMETDLAIADLVESGMRFIRYVQKFGSVEQAKTFAEAWNNFIQTEIKK
jgi:hypothetical protein